MFGKVRGTETGQLQRQQEITDPTPNKLKDDKFVRDVSRQKGKVRLKLSAASDKVWEAPTHLSIYLSPFQKEAVAKQHEDLKILVCWMFLAFPTEPCFRLRSNLGGMFITKPYWNLQIQHVYMNGGKGRVIECMHALCNLCILLYGLIDFPCQYAMYIHVYTHIDDVYVGIHFGIKCMKPTYI